MIRKYALHLTAAAVAALAMASASAQDKVIKLIVPYPAGGNADNIGRLYAEGLARKLGQTVVVENRAGAGAVIGAQAAARSPGDGTVLFMAPTAVFTVTPHLKAVPYDAKKDFIPIAKVTSWIPMMVTRKDFPAKNLQELVALAKKNPGKFTFASAGPATMTHLMGELMNVKYDMQTVHVPYKGSADFIPDLLSGRIDMVYDSVVVPQVRDGKLNALASMVDARHPQLPNVATLRELGADIDMPNWYGVFAPKGMSPAMVEQYGNASKEVVENLDKAKLTQMSMFASFQGPAAFKAQIEKDDALLRDVIKKANISVSD